MFHDGMARMVFTRYEKKNIPNLLEGGVSVSFMASGINTHYTKPNIRQLKVMG